MCLSRIGWRDGLTSCNRLSPRRIGGSSRFVDVVGSSFALCDRRLEFDRVSRGALVRCAHCFHGEAWNTPGEKGRSADTVRRTASGACVHAENYSSAGRIFTKDIVVSCHCEKRSRSRWSIYQVLFRYRCGKTRRRDTRQIELSIIRYKEEDSLAGSIGGGNKRKQEISVRQLDRAILSLPAQIFSDSISTYSGNPATCYFDPLLDLFARIYSFPPSP